MKKESKSAPPREQWVNEPDPARKQRRAEWAHGRSPYQRAIVLNVKKVLDYVRQNPGATPGEIEAATKVKALLAEPYIIADYRDGLKSYYTIEQAAKKVLDYLRQHPGAKWREIKNETGFDVHHVGIPFAIEERDGQKLFYAREKHEGAASPEAIVVRQSGEERNLASIHAAAQKGDCPNIEHLLAEGRAVGDKDKQGKEPLHWAAQSGQTEAVRLLLAKGAAVNATDENGATPLHLAALLGREAVVTVLLANRADVNAKAKNDSTPLHMAAKQGGIKVVQLLLAHKADTAAKDAGKRTPLMLAEENGFLPIVRLLRQ